MAEAKRTKHKLSAREAATTKPGRYGDGAGLYLVVSPLGGRKWVYRFTFAGKVSEMGLGAANAVSLAAARRKAEAAAELIAAGGNPIEAKRNARAQDEIPTFGDLATELIATREAGWRNEKHKDQWRSSLETYARPLWKRRVDAIGVSDVLAVLKPIWTKKPETASRVRGRIEAVLDAAKAQGHRSGENPAAWRGHLSHLLPKRPKLSRGHHAALPYADVPAFIERLRQKDNTAGNALEFAILTATRSAEVYGARWSEIDMGAKVWTIPADRMKAGKEHRVPLSTRAMAILKTLDKNKTSEFVFESPRGKRPLSHIAMAKVIARMGVEGATPHGFRSSFRDWAGNETQFPREVAEAALAHTVGDKAEQAYRRGDALEKRRALMDAWATFCEPRTASNVVPLKKVGGSA